MKRLTIVVLACSTAACWPYVSTRVVEGRWTGEIEIETSWYPFPYDATCTLTEDPLRRVEGACTLEYDGGDPVPEFFTGTFVGRRRTSAVQLSGTWTDSFDQTFDFDARLQVEEDDLNGPCDLVGQDGADSYLCAFRLDRLGD